MNKTVVGHLFQEANRFQRAQLQETDNGQGQISRHDFAPKGDYCVSLLRIIFAKRAVLKIGECHSDIPQFYLGHIQSRDAFRPIVRERKHLMDYNGSLAVMTKPMNYPMIQFLITRGIYSQC